MDKYDIAVIGLSVMGRSLALNMADHGYRVAVYNRSKEVTEAMVKEYPHEGIQPYYSLEELTGALCRPRKIIMMIKAGAPVDAVIGNLAPLLEEGDILMDGGNSFFEDTRRRSKLLEQQGIRYYGVGISGGEEGARFGPSIMPGGDADAYGEIGPILRDISAKAEGEPCCTYIGPDGAGHYVKMVHNGIEYADMQLIAEAYLLLKYIGGFDNQRLSEIFGEWQSGELKSYLIGITADILKEPDDCTTGELVDYILDSAAQKGTGRWTSIESLKQGIDVSMITAACNARVMSNRLQEREKAFRLLKGPDVTAAGEPLSFIRMVREGLYAAKILAYAQGFSLLKDASKQYEWNLELGKIASIFRAGCIIQAVFLNDITAAFQENPNLENLLFHEFFRQGIEKNQGSLREIVTQGIKSGLPLPAMTNALAYLDAFRGAHVGANLIQAQRDCFGAHTYLRTDQEGSFHHDWGKKKED